MADILLKQANLSEIPLRVLTALPTALPGAGYANLLCQDTVDGKRAFLRLPDGSLVNLFTVNTETTIDNTIDNTITNNVDNSITVYQINDMPAPNTLDEGNIAMIIDTAGTKSWLPVPAEFAIKHKALKSHRFSDWLGISLTQTLVNEHANTYLNFLNTSAIVETIPASTAGLFDQVGMELEIARNGTGAVTVTPAGGVTINGVTASVSVSKQYGIVVLKLIALNTWVAYGDLA